jgi:hypothetical protein
VRFVADQQAAADVGAERGNLIDLLEQRLRIDHHAVADHAGDAGMEDARRDQVEDELLAVDIHGVAGVVPALITRHRGEVRGEHVNDLALALISPLRSQDGNIGLRHSALWYRTASKITKRPRPDRRKPRLVK